MFYSNMSPEKQQFLDKIQETLDRMRAEGRQNDDIKIKILFDPSHPDFN